METTDQFNGKPGSVALFIDLNAVAVVDCLNDLFFRVVTSRRDVITENEFSKERNFDGADES